VSVGGVKKKNGHLMFGYKDVRVVHLEPTQLCQAMCPMCDRVTLDGYLNPLVENLSLSINDIKDIFSIEFVKQLDKMYMCGNVGDPMLTPDCLEILEYFRENNPNIFLSMVTNGGARKPDFWKEVAKLCNKVTFSIDGLEDTNHIYRKGVKWSNVMDNTRAFIEAEGNAHWHYLVFEHNEHQIMDAYKLSEEMGFINFQAKTTNRYKPESRAWKMYLRGKETGVLAQPKQKKYQSEVYKKPLTFEEKSKLDIVPKCTAWNGIYVAADGSVFPCCWAHTSLISSQNISGQEKLDMVDQSSYYKINAKEVGLKKVIEDGWFDSFEKRWKSEDKPYICITKCNSKQDPFALQYIDT